MRSLIRSWLVVVVVVVVVSCVWMVCKPARADTYQIFQLWSDNVSFYGMDDSGDVALYINVCPNGGPCYYTFHDGGATGIAALTAPDFIDDSGRPCTPVVPAGGFVLYGICNNGRDAFSGSLDAVSHPLPSVYVGTLPDFILLAGLGGGQVFMNSNGDVVFNDVFADDWYFALDTTTAVPEPGTFVLILTGFAGATGASRYRREV